MAKPTDPVLLYLIAVNLADREVDYRGLLQVAGAKEEPEVRHFAIATVAFMLQLAQVPMPAIMTVVDQLKGQSDAQIKDGLVAILNGSHLIVSRGSDATTMYLIGTMQQTSEPPRYTLTSNMYHVNKIFEQIEAVLSGKA